MKRYYGKARPTRASHTFFIEYGDKEYEITGTATFSHDSDYGSDADGNRGIPMDFIDDVFFELDAAGKLLPEETQKLLLAMAEEQSDTGEWERECEYDGDDREPDEYEQTDDDRNMECKWEPDNY